MSQVPLDWLVGVLNLLKTKWSLTGDLAVGTIQWTTGRYQAQLGTPQVSVEPQIEPHRQLSIGPTPSFLINRILKITVWVARPTSSNVALGRAKNQRYQIEQEIERILRNNTQAVPGIKFIRFNEIFAREHLHLRPAMLMMELRINLLDFRNFNSELPVPLPFGIFEPTVFEPIIFQT